MVALWDMLAEDKSGVLWQQDLIFVPMKYMQPRDMLLLIGSFFNGVLVRISVEIRCFHGEQGSWMAGGF